MLLRDSTRLNGPYVWRSRQSYRLFPNSQKQGSKRTPSFHHFETIKYFLTSVGQSARCSVHCAGLKEWGVLGFDFSSGHGLFCVDYHRQSWSCQFFDALFQRRLDFGSDVAFVLRACLCDSSCECRVAECLLYPVLEVFSFKVELQAFGFDGFYCFEMIEHFLTSTGQSVRCSVDAAGVKEGDGS